MWGRARWLAAGVVVALLVTGCSGSGSKPGQAVGSSGGTVKLSPGISVVVPAGAALDGTRLVLDGDAEGPTGAAELTSSDHFVDIEVTEGQIVAPVTVEFADVDPAFADGKGVEPAQFGLHQIADGSWESTEARYDPERRVMSVATPGLSVTGWVRVPGQALRDLAQEVWHEMTGGLSDQAAPPTCQGEDAARADGWQILASDTQQVRWCFGMEGGQRLVKVVNANRYPRSFAVTGAAAVDQPPSGLAAWVSQHAGAAASGSGSSSIGAGGQLTVAPGPTPGTATSITSDYDGAAEAAFQLHFGVALAEAFLGRFGLATPDDPGRTTVEQAVTRAGDRLSAATLSGECSAALSAVAANPGVAPSGSLWADCVVPTLTTAEGAGVRAMLAATSGVAVSGVGWVLSIYDYATDIGKDAFKLLVAAPAPTPVCDSGLLWQAARAALGLDPYDPGYVAPAQAGFGPGVYGVSCHGDWALGEVSRPNTGTTDAADVFHWVDGRWAYAGDAGTPPTTCALARMGMPADVIDHLLPPSARVPDVEAAQCGTAGR